MTAARQGHPTGSEGLSAHPREGQAVWDVRPSSDGSKRRDGLRGHWCRPRTIAEGWEGPEVTTGCHNGSADRLADSAACGGSSRRQRTRLRATHCMRCGACCLAGLNVRRACAPADQPTVTPVRVLGRLQLAAIAQRRAACSSRRRPRRQQHHITGAYPPASSSHSRTLRLQQMHILPLQRTRGTEHAACMHPLSHSRRTRCHRVSGWRAATVPVPGASVHHTALAPLLLLHGVTNSHRRTNLSAPCRFTPRQPSAAGMRSTGADRCAWTLKQQAAAKLLGGVTSLDVCAVAPHDYCASAGTRLHVFDGATSAAKRQFTRFKDRAYGGSFRADGRLLVAGGEDAVVQVGRAGWGVQEAAGAGRQQPASLGSKPRHSYAAAAAALQVFDAASRTLLRQLKGHKAPVHVARFAAGQLHVITGGDDGLVALWDITSGQQARTCRCLRSTRAVTLHAWAVANCRLQAPRWSVQDAQSDDSAAVCSPLDARGCVLQLCTLRGHTDYVRAAAGNPVHPDLWATTGCVVC